jgi:hypothetical protein
MRRPQDNVWQRLPPVLRAEIRSLFAFLSDKMTLKRAVSEN